MPRNVNRSSIPFSGDTPRSYLDIETTAEHRITVVGIFRPDAGSKQWTAPDIRADDLLDFMKGVEILFTYNGARFDLPIIKDQLGVDLPALIPHRDLMHDCWARRLFGGLKKVEKTLGIHRDTEGVDGLAAIRLWDQFQRTRDAEALELLLRYNREDVENLETLAVRLGVVAPPNGIPPAPVYGGTDDSLSD